MCRSMAAYGVTKCVCGGEWQLVARVGGGVCVVPVYWVVGLNECVGVCGVCI